MDATGHVAVLVFGSVVVRRHETRGGGLDGFRRDVGAAGFVAVLAVRGIVGGRNQVGCYW
jgi:hypothetical protein